MGTKFGLYGEMVEITKTGPVMPQTPPPAKDDDEDEEDRKVKGGPRIHDEDADADEDEEEEDRKVARKRVAKGLFTSAVYGVRKDMADETAGRRNSGPFMDDGAAMFQQPKAQTFATFSERYPLSVEQVNDPDVLTQILDDIN